MDERERHSGAESETWRTSESQKNEVEKTTGSPKPNPIEKMFDFTQQQMFVVYPIKYKCKYIFYYYIIIIEIQPNLDYMDYFHGILSKKINN